MIKSETKRNIHKLFSFLPGYVDLIKLDVEGEEYRILSELFDSEVNVANFIVEIHQNREKIEATLISNGYKTEEYHSFDSAFHGNSYNKSTKNYLISFLSLSK